MAKPRRRTRFHEPSLVPMADMLTNTVGVVVFILIFTVLTAGGAVLAKRLPMERKTDRDSVMFICEGGRVVPILPATDESYYTKRSTVVQNGRKASNTLSQIVDELNKVSVEDEYIILTCEAEFRGRGVDVSTRCKVKPEVGFTAGAIRKQDQGFLALLQGLNSRKQFCVFLVRPDSLDVYAAARDAAASLDFATGWSPMPAGQVIRFGEGGRQIDPQ